MKKKTTEAETQEIAVDATNDTVYDPPVLSKLVSFFTVIALIACTLCVVFAATKVSEPTVAPNTVVSNNNGSSNSGGSDTNNNSGNNGGNQNSAPVNNGSVNETPDNSQNTDTPADPDSPSYEEIFAKYNEVVQNLKDNVSEYHKKEWQRMDDDYDMGTLGNLVMPAITGLMTSEADAEDQVRTDKEQIPLETNDKATIAPISVDNFKSATMTESGGKTTIEIVLYDEVDAKPADEGATSSPSFTGAMFNPMSTDRLDGIIDTLSKIASINNFSITYNNCTATLVFDTETLEVETFEQIMPMRMDVDASLAFLSISGYATIINTTTVDRITYK